MKNPPAQPPVRQRRMGPLLALLGVFLLPILGTALLQLFPGWVPQGRTNHGELLQPAPEIPALTLTDLQGQAGLDKSLRGKWQLLWLARGECATHCTTVLPELERIQLALGKDAHRAAVAVLLLDDSFSLPAAGREVTAFKVEPSQRQALLATLQAPTSGDALYLVDPVGHAVLRYALDADPKGILKDLERLLKYSWLG